MQTHGDPRLIEKRLGPARARDPRVVIVGAGMSGMLMGIRLKRAGIESFEILEKAASVGGTWRDNTYPGLACDVPAYLYTYSFEPNPECSHRYARGPEIRAYFERVYRKYDLERHVRFGQEVTSARFEGFGWTITTADGTTRRADVVVSATGILHHPNVPEIEGVGDFRGAVFHSARWDHGVPLDGKRVGIIGTGSTAVQIVCGLVERVAELKLFQRTPQWVIPAFDVAYRDWRKPVLRRFPWIARLFHFAYALFYDSVLGSGFLRKRTLFFRFFEMMARRHLARVADPELRKRLTPSHRIGCKRFVLSDDFYTAIQEPQVELVTEGIERIEREGVRTRDGRLHELDVLVLATGFKAHEYVRPMKVIGPTGRTLDEAWSNGVQAYRSVALPGFPNYFLLQGPHGPIGNYSLIKISEVQTAYLMQIIEGIRRGEWRTAAPREDVTAEYNRALEEGAEGTIWTSPGCQSWYLDPHGRLSIWPWTLRHFREQLREPRYEEYDFVE